MQQPPNYGGWPQQPNTQYPPQQPPWRPQPPPPNTYYPPPPWQQPPMMPPPPPRPPRKKANPWLILAIVIGVLIVIGAIANTAKTSPSIQATATAGVVQATVTPIPTNTRVPLTQTVSSDVHFKAGEAAGTPDGYTVTMN